MEIHTRALKSMKFITCLIVATMFAFAVPIYHIVSWDWTFRSIGDDFLNILLYSMIIGLILGFFALKIPIKIQKWLLFSLMIVGITCLIIAFPSSQNVVQSGGIYSNTVLWISAVYFVSLQVAMLSGLGIMIRRKNQLHKGSKKNKPENMTKEILSGIGLGGAWGTMHVVAGYWSVLWIFTSWTVLLGCFVLTAFTMKVKIPISTNLGETGLKSQGKNPRQRAAQIGRYMVDMFLNLFIALGGSVLLSVVAGGFNNVQGDYETNYYSAIYTGAIAIAAFVGLMVFQMIRMRKKPSLNTGKSAKTRIYFPLIALLALALPITLLRLLGSSLLTNFGLMLEEYAYPGFPLWLLIGIPGAISIVIAIFRSFKSSIQLKSNNPMVGFMFFLVWAINIPALMMTNDIARLFFDNIFNWYFDAAILLVIILSLVFIIPLGLKSKGKKMKNQTSISRGKKGSRRTIILTTGLLLAIVFGGIPIGVSLPRYLDLPNQLPYDDTTPDWNALFTPPAASPSIPSPTTPPEWAVAEYKALQAYKEWAHFWIDNQRDDGSFGGRLEDDVELIKTFPLLTYIASDQEVNRSLTNLVEAVWRSGTMQDGFTNRNPYWADVEHMAEPLSYTLPMMLLLDYENQNWLEKAYEAAIHFGMDWTGINDAGHRLMRGHYFNGYDFDLREGRDTENPENGRAIKHATITAWRDRSPALLQWLGEWGQSMAYFANLTSDDNTSAVYGKPIGFLPSEIDYESDEVGHYTGNWYEAFYKELGHVSYSWTKGFNGVRQQIDSFLNIGALTNDSFILDMVGQMYEYFCLNTSVNGVPANEPDLDTDDQLQFNATTGELLWEDDAEMRMPNTALLWQKITGNTSLNSYFHEWGKNMVLGMRSDTEGPWSFGNVSTDGYDRETNRYKDDDPEAMGPAGYLGWWYGDRNNKTLARWSLESIAECVKRLWEQETKGIAHTAIQDRDDWEIIGYTDHTAQQLEPDGEMLMWFATGGIGGFEGRYPYLPVSYENSNYGITPLVMDENATDVHILFYNFKNEASDITLRFWQLENGTYNLEAGVDSLDADDEADSIDFSTTFSTIGRNTRVNVTIPARSIYSVKVSPDGATNVLLSDAEHEPEIFKQLFNTTRISVNGRIYDSHQDVKDVRTWAYLDDSKNELIVYFKTERLADLKHVDIRLEGTSIESARMISWDSADDGVISSTSTSISGLLVDYTMRGVKITLLDAGGSSIDPGSLQIIVSLSLVDPLNYVPLLSVAFLGISLGLILIRKKKRIKNRNESS